MRHICEPATVPDLCQCRGLVQVQVQVRGLVLVLVLVRVLVLVLVLVTVLVLALPRWQVPLVRRDPASPRSSIAFDSARNAKQPWQ